MAKAATKTAKHKPKKPTLWKTSPDEHDYPAAYDYLSLLFPEKTTRVIVNRLRTAEIVHRKAKDLLRASGLHLLSSDSEHVSKDMNKVTNGILLSPVLLVRGDLGCSRMLLVADGYHRICASEHFSENWDIPCKIADVP
ncbi:MAG: hypothetical protein ACJ762_10880 [Solirubrobacteraceae bacterium]